MSDNEKTVIEINGVKMEIDLRHAKRIDEIRVGDRVKVLRKEYSSYKVSPGVVIGFEPFKSLPTIIVAFVDIRFREARVDFVYFNSESKELEIVKAIDDDQIDIDKTNVLAMFDAEVAAKRREIEEIEERRAYFLREFRAYWERVEA